MNNIVSRLLRVVQCVRFSDIFSDLLQHIRLSEQQDLV